MGSSLLKKSTDSPFRPINSPTPFSALHYRRYSFCKYAGDISRKTSEMGDGLFHADFQTHLREPSSAFKGIENLRASPECSDDETRPTGVEASPPEAAAAPDARAEGELRLRTELTLGEHFGEHQIREITAFSGAKIKRLTSEQKLLSIARYLDKKTKRNTVSQVRYKIRQDLASKRLRVKGKFVKNKRVDLRLVASQLLNG